MKSDGIHWNINEILPYQRNFNFINSVRDYGKTYSCFGYFFEQFFKKGREFVYFVRKAKDLKEANVMDATAKVRDRIYPDEKFVYLKNTMYHVKEEADGKILTPVAYTLCLKDFENIKRKSFPRVYYGLFDEYVKEEGITEYVTGWQEPKIILNIYDSIDRKEDRLKLFFLANHITPYNPYHLYPVFKLPIIQPGEIYKNKNVLFQNAKPGEKFLELMKENRFSEMVEGSEYGNYAHGGEYLLLDNKFIKKRTPGTYLLCNINYSGFYFGVWWNRKETEMFISDKYNLQERTYVIETEDHGLNTILIKGKGNTVIKFIAEYFRNARLYYETEEIKARAEMAIWKIV